MTDMTQGEPTVATPEPVKDEVRTVGPREGLGAGIIALGILSVALPAVVDQLPSVTNGGSAAFVLYGMSILIAWIVGLTRAKSDPDQID